MLYTLHYIHNPNDLFICSFCYDISSFVQWSLLFLQSNDQYKKRTGRISEPKFLYRNDPPANRFLDVSFLIMTTTFACCHHTDTSTRHERKPKMISTLSVVLHLHLFSLFRRIRLRYYNFHV